MDKEVQLSNFKNFQNKITGSIGVFIVVVVIVVVVEISAVVVVVLKYSF